MEARMRVPYRLILLLVLCRCEEVHENTITTETGHPDLAPQKEVHPWKVNETPVYRTIVSDSEIPVSFVARDCGDLYLSGYNISGIYSVRPLNWQTEFQVYCDMHTDQGGWTVFQRRGDYYGFPEDYFLKNWTDYKYGFGDLSKEFWLGNERIFALTRQGAYQLRVDLWDADENHAFAKYGRFWIANETDLYRINLGGYSGNAGNAMLFHNLNQFATTDRDGGDCVKHHKGAWWNNPFCHNVNLNGINLKGPNKSRANGIVWYQWKGHEYSLSFTELKVRHREFLRLIRSSTHE